nr:uncharacterized protein LOC127299096 [Lolium perenne]XP_051184947.1 uncharacterized protein LOC127299096 [Lolium perenne]XP_051184948.1 uncharacterized protein LOC127299096 [Lolium perenne]XP_051184949.1 uncharacterized protein LOC127299096 [Lolium perenne]
MRKSPKKPRQNAAGREEASSSARDGIDVLPFDTVMRPRSSRDAMKESPKKPRQNATGRDEVSSSARDGIDVLPFDVVRRPRSSRDAMKESPKKPRQNATGRDEVSSSARDGIDVLPFDVVRRPRSSRDAMEEMKIMDAAEALVLLQESCGKGTSFDDEPGVDYPGIESAADNPNESRDAMEEMKIMDAAEALVLLQESCGKGTSSDDEPGVDYPGIESTADNPNESRDAMEEMKIMDAAEALVLLQESCGKGTSSDDEPGVDYPGIESAADNPNEVLQACLDKRISAAECNSHPVVEMEVEETELTRNDDGQGLVVFHENSTVMELKRPKLDLKVSDKSENTASDDSEGGDASGKQTCLTEPMAREVDQKPEQKLDALEEQAAKGTTSVDEPGTGKPGEESGADNMNEVLTSCSEKSSCSVECYGGGEGTSDLKEAAGASSAYPYVCTENSGNEASAVEEEELSRKHRSQALADCPKKSAVIEVERKKPKLDHQVLDNFVVTQEGKQKVCIDAPAPRNISEEEISDVVDGEANQTA